MNVFIIQKDGSRTPIDIRLLAKLAQAGRLQPETTLEVDGERKRAYELDALAPIFERQGYVAPPATSVPPRADVEPEKPKPAPEPEPTLENELELTELEIARIAARRVGARFKSERTICQIVTTLAILCAFISAGELFFGALSEHAAARGGWGSALFRIPATALALAAYYGVRACFRAGALLREESAIRQELFFKKTTRER